GPRGEVDLEVAASDVRRIRCPDGCRVVVDDQIAVRLHDDVRHGLAVRATRPFGFVGGVIQDEVAVRLQDEVALAGELDLLPLVETLPGIHAKGGWRLRVARERQREQSHQDEEKACLGALHGFTSECRTVSRPNVLPLAGMTHGLWTGTGDGSLAWLAAL